MIDDPFQNVHIDPLKALRGVRKPFWQKIKRSKKNQFKHTILHQFKTFKPLFSYALLTNNIVNLNKDQPLPKLPDVKFYLPFKDLTYVVIYDHSKLAIGDLVHVRFVDYFGAARFESQPFPGSHPYCVIGPPPGSLRWLAKGLDRKVLVHLAALLRRA